ncbi:MAG: hypothetical protein QNJ31_06865 [Candidatus Caenarcaniphilales bacterium]|nr:hypothetical protein [Candidatus Caenarcaniphilales bacterium]
MKIKHLLHIPLAIACGSIVSCSKAKNISTPKLPQNIPKPEFHCDVIKGPMGKATRLFLTRQDNKKYPLAKPVFPPGYILDTSIIGLKGDPDGSGNTLQACEKLKSLFKIPKNQLEKREKTIHFLIDNKTKTITSNPGTEVETKLNFNELLTPEHQQYSMSRVTGLLMGFDNMRNYMKREISPSRWWDEVNQNTDKVSIRLTIPPMPPQLYCNITKSSKPEIGSFVSLNVEEDNDSYKSIRKLGREYLPHIALIGTLNPTKEQTDRYLKVCQTLQKLIQPDFDSGDLTRIELDRIRKQITVFPNSRSSSAREIPFSSLLKEDNKPYSGIELFRMFSIEYNSRYTPNTLERRTLPLGGLPIAELQGPEETPVFAIYLELPMKRGLTNQQ